MKQRHTGIYASVLVLICIIVGMFVFTYIKRSEIETEKLTDKHVSVEKDETVPYGTITQIDAVHFIKNREHTIVGEIQMPTPCDLLSWDTRVLESYPEQVIIDFEVVNHAEICAQSIASQPFNVSFVAEEQATIRATLADREVLLSLRKARADESPEDYEI